MMAAKLHKELNDREWSITILDNDEGCEVAKINGTRSPV